MGAGLAPFAERGRPVGLASLVRGSCVGRQVAGALTLR